jgi:hypothetical protein
MTVHGTYQPDAATRLARRFCRAELPGAVGHRGHRSAPIAGNAAHSPVATDLAVPAPVAVGVAVAPTNHRDGLDRGLSLLVRSGRRSKVTSRLALMMTAFHAVVAFALSFEALQDLAVRSGIPKMLAWLWPLIIDVSIAQATLALLALWRPEGAASQGDYEDLDVDTDENLDDDEDRGTRRRCPARGNSCAARTGRVAQPQDQATPGGRTARSGARRAAGEGQREATRAAWTAPTPSPSKRITAPG